MITPQREAELLRSLLGKREPERFSAQELSRKAQWRWDRNQFLEAAVLFDAAAVKSEAEVSRSRPQRDNTFNYRIRSGVTFRLAGACERAWPILQEALTFDWSDAGIPEDGHFTEWAVVEMLCILAERNDQDRFAKVFWQGVNRCNELGAPFPRVYAKQVLLLELCDRLGMNRELDHVLTVVGKQGDKEARRVAQRVIDSKRGASEPPT